MHYEFVETPSTENDSHEGTYRIRATQDIPAQGVKKGDLGGWVSKEATMDEDCWVFDDAVLGNHAMLLRASSLHNEAKVLDNVVVTNKCSLHGRATATDNVRVENDSHIKHNSTLSQHAIVRNSSLVSGFARISGHAQVDESSRVDGYSRVSDNAVVFNDSEVLGRSEIGGNAWVSDTTVVHAVLQGDDIKASRPLNLQHYNYVHGITGRRDEYILTP